jgi:predicted component of type VI protein secretion system
VPQLIITRDGRVEREVNFGTAIRIGRDPENDLLLEDPDRGVSRFHAEIRWQNSAYVVTDLNSRNGTWIGSERITSAPLTPGTNISIGPFKLEFREQGAEDTSPSAAQGSEYTVFAGNAAQRHGHEAAAHIPRPPQPRRPPIVRNRRAMLFLIATVAVACVIGLSQYCGSR